MRIAAVVENFNDLEGEIWRDGLAAAIREKTGADYVITAMAGDFLENICLAAEEKYRRAEWACAAGMDMALELPVSVCLSDLATKAFSSLSMLKRLYGVDDLVILCHRETGKKLSSITDFIFRASPEYRAELGRCLQREEDFFAAQAQAAERFFPGAADLLSDPYNQTAVELLKARYQLYWTIKPVFLDIEELEAGQSKEEPDKAAKPEKATKRDKAAEPNFKAEQKQAALFLGGRLRQLFQGMSEEEGKRRLEGTPDGGPELLECIREKMGELKQTEDLEEMVQVLWEKTLSGKPIPKNTIRAFLLQLLIGIQRGNLIICGLRANCPYTRVLGMKPDAAPVLSYLQEKSWVPLLVELSYEAEQRAQERKKLDECGQMLAALDDAAHELYLQSRRGSRSDL